MNKIRNLRCGPTTSASGQTYACACWALGSQYWWQARRLNTTTSTKHRCHVQRQTDEWSRLSCDGVYRRFEGLAAPFANLGQHFLLLLHPSAWSLPSGKPNWVSATEGLTTRRTNNTWTQQYRIVSVPDELGRSGSLELPPPNLEPSGRPN